MGYAKGEKQEIYPDTEVLDYYESEESDDEISMDDLEVANRDDSGQLNLPPPALGGGLLRRHNAAIFMPLRVPSLYG